MSAPVGPSWDERYRSETYYYGTEPNDFLKEVESEFPRGARILCLAEGEGRNAVFLASRGHQVTAVDGSRVGLEKLRMLAQSRDVEVECVHADLADYEIGEQKWDAIVSIWCHLPLPLRQRVHSASVQGLKSGGLFVLEAYRPEQLEYKTGGPSVVELLMKLADLRKELSPLAMKITEEKIRDVQEGQGHHGPSAVVQILAQKE